MRREPGFRTLSCRIKKTKKGYLVPSKMREITARYGVPLGELTEKSLMNYLVI